MPNPIADELEKYMPSDDGVRNGQVRSRFMMPSIGSLLIPTGDDLPKWWDESRDRRLEQLLFESPHLSGLADVVITKLTTVPLSFQPKNKNIAYHEDYAQDFTTNIFYKSELGETLLQTLRRYVADWITFDNGAFMEIIGNGPKDGQIIGPPEFVRHLDSRLCTRTGHPKYPVSTIDITTGQRYALHFSRVIYSSQMPSGRKSMNGVGLSSVSRSHLLGRILTDQLTYKAEKMGTRPGAKLVIGKGLDAQSMIMAYATSQAMMDNMGLSRYGLNVFIGIDPDADIDTKDINNFDPFNEEEGTLMAMYSLAYIWGLKIQDIWPLAGSKASDEIANMQSRGRVSAEFFLDMKTQMDFKLCPRFLKTVFDAQDDQEDHQRAVIEDIQTRSNQRMAEGALLDNQAQRRIMVEQGRLSREEFVRQQLAEGYLENGTPVAILFHSQDRIHHELLTMNSVPKPLLYEENDPAETIKAIHEQMDACYAFMANTSSEAQLSRAREAMAALTWLESQYESQKFEGKPEPEMEEPEETQGQEQPEEEPEESDEYEPEPEEPESPSPGKRTENEETVLTSW